MAGGRGGGAAWSRTRVGGGAIARGGTLAGGGTLGVPGFRSHSPWATGVGSDCTSFPTEGQSHNSPKAGT